MPVSTQKKFTLRIFGLHDFIHATVAYLQQPAYISLSQTSSFPRAQAFEVKLYIFLVENNKIPGGEFFIEQIAWMYRDHRRFYFSPHLLSKLYGVIAATETTDFSK